MMFAVEEVQTIKHKGSDWFDPIVLQEALTESHLGCIVSSWYDDNEWLVAFSPDVLRLEQRRI
jgi:hypothetical protein